MSTLAPIPVGVVVERRAIDNPWQDHRWLPVGVIPGAPPFGGWRELVSGDGWVQYLAGVLPLELHRSETIGYKHNLESGEPALYVVLRVTDDDEAPVQPLLVTASPYEASAYMESGEEIVEPLPMPGALVEVVANFVAEHHVEEPFRKRQRDKVKVEEHKFGQEPIVTMRQRMRSRSDG